MLCDKVRVVAHQAHGVRSSFIIRRRRVPFPSPWALARHAPRSVSLLSLLPLWTARPSRR